MIFKVPRNIATWRKWILLIIVLLPFMPKAFAVPHGTYGTFSSSGNRIQLNISEILTISDTVIYNQAYVSVASGDWQTVNVEGRNYQSSSWIENSGTIDLSSFNFPQDEESYILIYSCTNNNNNWVCHGRNEEENGFWQLYVINSTDVDIGDNFSEQIMIDFGGSVTTAGWNLYQTYTFPSLVLRTNENLITEAYLEITDDFEWVNELGLETSSVFPAAVSRDSFIVGEQTHQDALGELGSMDIHGLEPNSPYNLTFFGSHNGDDGGRGRLTRYTVNGEWKDLEISDNLKETISFSTMSNASGSISFSIEVSPAGTGRYAFLGALSLDGVFPKPQSAPIGSGLIVTMSSSPQHSSPYTLVDGDYSTNAGRWAAWGPQVYLYFDFQEEITIDALRGFFYEGSSRTYEVDVSISDDGETWNPVADFASAYATERLFEFPTEVTSRYFRLRTYANNGGNIWISFYELDWLYNSEKIDFLIAQNCVDGIHNNEEEGVDCGGPHCDPCPTCSDGLMNQDELAVDCGPSCPDTSCCSNGEWDLSLGEIALDCGPSCPDTTCCSNSQLDHLQGETGIDCGGDCSVCLPTCSDGIMNQDETGIDCGGVCTTDCCENGYADLNLLELDVDCGGVCIASCNAGTTYYISNEGDDNADGLTPSTAWASISKINSESFGPGDSILFRRGDIWRNQLILMDSGTELNRITYGAYGTGDKPRIFGSVNVSGWTLTGTPNVWQSQTTFNQNPFTQWNYVQIFFAHDKKNSSWGEYIQSRSSLDAEFEWTWENGHVYVFSPQDPTNRYFAVEVPHNRYIIRLFEGYPHYATQDYITIDNLDLRYSVSSGIDGDPDRTAQRKYGLTVTNSHIAYIGVKDSAFAYGIDAHHSDSYYAFNEIHDCGRRAISLVMYDTSPSIQENVLIENNYFHHGWHTTGVDCNTIGAHIIRNITVRNNYFEGNPEIVIGGGNSPSNHIFFADQSGGRGLVTDLYVYNNLFTYSHGKAIIFENVYNGHFLYNTIYGFNPSLTIWQSLISVVGHTSNNYNIYNNIVYNSNDLSLYHLLWSFTVGAALDYSPDTVDYNLWWGNTPETRMWQFINPQATPWYLREYDLDAYQTFRSDWPYDQNSPVPSDPMFVNVASDALQRCPSVDLCYTYPDLSVSQGSDAIANALAVSWITTDFYGNPRDPVNPTIGAVEYGG